MRKFSLLVFILTAVGCPLQAVHAQTTDVPGRVDANRIDEQFNMNDNLLPQSVPDQRAVPVVQSSAPAGAETILFVLKGITIEGATAYSAVLLEQYYSNFLNREISVADLYGITDAITRRYRSDGYIVAQAFLPPQMLDDGYVTINVVEPYISEVNIEGPVSDADAVQRLIAPWAHNKILNVNDLEETLLHLNDLPGIAVQSVLEPVTNNSDEQAGALALRLVFAEVPHSYNVSFDNFGSRFIGPFQMGEHARLNNIFGVTGQTDIQFYQATQRDELFYAGLAHRIPILWPGLNFKVKADYSAIQPGASLKPNEIKSYGRAVSIALDQSLIRSRSENLNLSLSLESKRSKTKILGGRLYEDRLTIAMMEASYDAADGWNGQNLINLRLRKGLDILGVRESGSVDLSRLDGQSDFTSWQMQVSRLQRIYGGLSLYCSVRGQYTDDPLLSSEEFGYGGNAIGRAYNASEIVGDKGVSGLVEIRYNTEINDNFSLQPYGFYDVGKVWNIDLVDKNQFSGASAGIGVRAWLGGAFSADFSVAQPLTRRIETPQHGKGDTPVIKFSLGYRF